MARTIGYVLAAFLLCTALVCGNSFADAPKLVNYQGYLTDSVGAPITGTRSMVFGLYNAASAGTLLWSETQASVVVSNGIYQVNLGSVTPLALSFNQQYYLGIAVGGDPEMTPRQPLTGTPYALGLAPGSTVTLSDPASNASALSVTSNSTNADVFSVTKTGLYGNGGSFVINEPTNNYGAVYGFTQGTGAGIYGVATTGGSAGQFDVGGTSNSKPALLAQTLGTGNAGRFDINNPASTNHAVYANTNGSGYGVYGSSTSSSGVYGSSASSFGVYGVNTAATSGIAGVYGRAGNTTGTTYGVMGSCAGSTSYAVYGTHTTTNNYGFLGTNTFGAYGYNYSSHNYGGLGSTTAGVVGYGTTGVYAFNSSNAAIKAYLATASYAGDFTTDVRVQGEILREYVAGAPKNAVPVAYGTINGTGTISAGSGNFTVTYNSTSTWYEIAIIGESYYFPSYTTVVTPINLNTPLIATTYSGSNKLIVTIFNLSNAKVQNTFSFVVYRP